ncbi:LysM peptidoglycan-binding domain-containing protein [Salinicoccus kekensis]|uniref:Surface antigen n=1 Tax=Salinicoccus kekensis TaxID=714307 RepID=A0A285URP5_9STAP|nr:LysM peptidoglycan-binding domain-containing protein [Salinicoccus kekensis]SOC44534.1 surface antigen [Salinicoccus kekensis]
MKKVLTALTATAAISTYAFAQDAEASTHNVKSGDTLWSIAQKNNVTVSQLKSWNNLSSNLILVNQNLKVSNSDSSSSSSSATSSSSSNTPNTSSSATNSSSSNSTGGTYRVKSGDTLSSIARAHGMNYRTLMEINNISGHIIHPGQTLKTSTSSSSSSSSNNTSSSTASSNTSSSTSSSNTDSSAGSTATGGTYTVKSGDSLSRIASAHGTNYRTLMNINNLSSTIIYPGQTLKLSAGSSSTSSSSTASSNTSSSSASSSSTSSDSSYKAPAAPSNVSWGTNWYYWGDCTWYAFERRKELGKPVGNNWGNATNWAGHARSAGYTVNNRPSVGAIIQAHAWTNNAWGMGHVGVVERVNPDGSILISEMNFGGGQGVKAFRTLSASQAANHNFIH